MKRIYLKIWSSILCISMFLCNIPIATAADGELDVQQAENTLISFGMLPSQAENMNAKEKVDLANAIKKIPLMSNLRRKFQKLMKSPNWKYL